MTKAYQQVADRQKAEMRRLANPDKTPKEANRTFDKPVEAKAEEIKSARQGRRARTRRGAGHEPPPQGERGSQRRAWKRRPALSGREGGGRQARDAGRCQGGGPFADDAIAFAREAAREGQATADRNLAKEIDSALAKAAAKGTEAS